MNILIENVPNITLDNIFSISNAISNSPSLNTTFFKTLDTQPNTPKALGVAHTPFTKTSGVSSPYLTPVLKNNRRHLFTHEGKPYYKDEDGFLYVTEYDNTKLFIVSAKGKVKSLY
jgi:hypothetical protein